MLRLFVPALHVASLLLFSLCCSAQGGSNRWQWSAEVKGEQTAEVRRLGLKNKLLADTTGCAVESKRALATLHQAGYIAASQDSVRWDTARKVCQSYFYVGDKVTWGKLTVVGVSDSEMKEVRFSPTAYSGKPAYLPYLEKDLQRFTRYFQDKGFPLAQATVDSLQFESGRLSAVIVVQKNSLLRIRELQFAPQPKGKTPKLRLNYLYRYLGYQREEFYNRSKIERANTRLKELPFVKQLRSPTLGLQDSVGVLFLHLQHRRAGKSDFVLGFQPQRDVETGRTRLNLTGTARLDLFNAFAFGERLIIEWESLRPATQDLEVHANLPYILGKPFGVDARFNIYKRDSSYVDVIFDVGVQYLFVGSSYLKTYWRRNSTQIQHIDTLSIVLNKRLPNQLDVVRQTVGVEYSLQRLDYRFNPRSGFALVLRGEAGTRQILRNSTIEGLRSSNEPEFDYSSLYDTVTLRSGLFRVELQADSYFPFAPRATLRVAWRGAGLWASRLQFADLYRIGGNRLLRGFDEEGVAASMYQVLTIEPRYLLGENSYAFLFGDLAYTEALTQDSPSSSRRWGLGAGVSLETKVGIFGLSYALGSNFGSPAQFRNAKVHFGYVNLF